MSAVCPACGVAVVPGYVKCPRCHAGLPSAGRARRTTGNPGGTAVVQRGFPISAVLVAVGVAAVIILGFRMRSATRPAPAAPAVLPGPVEAIAQTAAASPTLPAPVVVAAPAPAAPSAVDPERRAAANGLENMLRQQRLWGRVEIVGDRMDIRSGSCGEPTMRSTIDAMGSELRGAGLTRLRCVEQSGAVVFERDL
jgi:hypothetical protein